MVLLRDKLQHQGKYYHKDLSAARSDIFSNRDAKHQKSINEGLSACQTMSHSCQHSAKPKGPGRTGDGVSPARPLHSLSPQVNLHHIPLRIPEGTLDCLPSWRNHSGAHTPLHHGCFKENTMLTCKKRITPFS